MTDHKTVREALNNIGECHCCIGFNCGTCQTKSTALAALDRIEAALQSPAVPNTDRAIQLMDYASRGGIVHKEEWQDAIALLGGKEG